MMQSLAGLRWVVTILFSVVAAIGMSFSVPLWMGKIAPNTMTGFRNARTLADPQLWHAVNTLMGKEMFFLNAIFLVLVLSCHFTYTLKYPSLASLALTGILTLGYVAIAIHCWQVSVA